jgi:hypothetical protein
MHLIQVEHLDEFGGQKSKPLWLTWLGLRCPRSSTFGDFTCVGLRLTTGIGLPNNVYTGLYPN